MDMNEAVAKALGAERSIAEMTVKELATAAGIPERSLMRILQAERDIKVNQVEQLAAAMKLYPHEIIERAEVILERAHRVAPDLEHVIAYAEPVSLDDRRRNDSGPMDDDSTTAQHPNPDHQGHYGRVAYQDDGDDGNLKDE